MGNWGSVPVSKRNFSFINTCNNILFGFVPVHSRKDSIFKLSSYFYNTNEREIYSDSEKTGDVKYHSFVTGKRPAWSRSAWFGAFLLSKGFLLGMRVKWW